MRRTRSRLGLAVACFTAFAAADMLVSEDAHAIPAFSRKEDQSCNACHSAYPKLNATGQIYKMNGYRFVGVEGTNIWEQKHVPVGFVAEVEAFYNSVKATDGSTSKEGPDGKIDEVELMGAGTLGKRVSFFTEIEFEGEPGFGDIDVGLGPVWGQVNDLLGPQGAMNLRLGQFDVDFPFLSQGRRVVRNGYLAADVLDYFETQFGADLNGQLLGDEDTDPIWRYGIGIIRSDVVGNDADPVDNNKFTKGYGWTSRTFGETGAVGVMVMGGSNHDEATAEDFDSVGVAAAAEIQLSQFIFTGAYVFEHQDFPVAFGNQKFHNLMGEVLWLPNESWVLGARLDWLLETERSRHKDDGLRGSVLLRYNLVSNVWIGGEYRGEDGGRESPVSSADTSHKGRLFVFLAY